MKIFEEYQARFHFPKGINPEIQSYATEEVFRESRYIFTWKIEKIQFGYCTHCGSTFPTEGLKHNAQVICPNCLSGCTVKSTGLGRGKMVDRAYFVYYGKSLIDQNAIIARGIYAVRDYRGDYTRVKTKYRVVTAYLFTQGNSLFFKRGSWYKEGGKFHRDVWRKAARVYSVLNKNEYVYTPCFYSRKSIASAVKGTCFQYSAWKEYNYSDLTEYFAMYSKYPCVEYLTKLGFQELITSKLRGEHTYGAVNWNGNNLLKVLRMTKEELNFIKQKKISIDFYLLKVIQTAKKKHWGLSLDDIIDFRRLYSDYHLEMFKGMTDDISPKYLFRYLKRQREIEKLKRPKDRRLCIPSDLTTYRDYIDDCKKLGLDLSKEIIVFPKDLYQAHIETNKRIMVKNDLETNRKIKDRFKELQIYYFEYGGLMIRPVESFEEMIDEGNALDHCVAKNYAINHANGKTNILLIRKVSEPTKPYYTVELFRNQLIQVQGFKHCNPDEDVKTFLKVFSSEKLGKKTSQNSLKTA